MDLYGYDDEYCTYCGNTVWEDPGLWEDYYETTPGALSKPVTHLVQADRYRAEHEAG